MNNPQAEETIKEILEEDKSEIRKAKRGRGCFLRLLIIITLIFIGVYGFILFRQKLLDLEAQAIVGSAQTATARSASAEETGLQKIVPATPLVESTAAPDLVATETP